MMNASCAAHAQTPAPSMQFQKVMANSLSMQTNVSTAEHAKMVAPLAQSLKHNYFTIKKKERSLTSLFFVNFGSIKI